MICTRILAVASTLIVGLLLPCSAAPQEKEDTRTAETVAEVPLLDQFHEVIFKLWHTAWPERNVEMLVELLPEIRHYSDTLATVELPGILREKRQVWNENIARLQEIVTEYGNATSPVDSQKLLDAAEQVHRQYEGLVRITRPVLKELEEFHQVLYMVYHHYLPDRDLAKLTASVTQLKVKMKSLESATLPERLKKREPAFDSARTALAGSVGELDAGMPHEDFVTFKKLVETVHSDYQKLQSVFE